MSNADCVIVYAPLLVINIIFLIDILKKDRQKPLIRYTLFVYVIIMGWQILDIMFHTLRDYEARRYALDIKLIFIAFLPIAIFNMFLIFFKLNRIVPKWLAPVLCIIPAFTTILALTSPTHGLLLRVFVIIASSPESIIMERGTWFWVHFIFSQLIMIMLAFVIFFKNKKMPKGYQRGSLLMVIGISVYLLGTFFESFSLDGGSYLDFNLISASLGSILFYFAITINDRMDYLHIEQKEIFNYLDEAVFILNNDGVIIDSNAAAHNIFSYLNKKYDHISFLELLNDKKISVKAVEGETTDDIYIKGAQFPRIYHRDRKLIQSSGKRLGEFSILTDVTENRLIIGRLEDMAGIDSLTGLPNRHRYHSLLRSLDREEHLPLSVIIGDANGLKYINDTHGHEMGDRLLKSIATVLKKCCTIDGYVARIGGDEFAILLPGYSMETAKRIVNNIRNEIAKIKGFPTKPSIALGFATKTNVDENINTLIYEADINMYSDKR